MMRAAGLALLPAMMGAPLTAQGLEGDDLRKALEDRAASFWIYDDLDAAYKKSRAEGKPLLVAFRCVP